MGVRLNKGRNRQNRNTKPSQAKFSMSMQKKLIVLFGLVLLTFLGLAGRLIYINREKGDSVSSSTRV